MASAENWRKVISHWQRLGEEVEFCEMDLRGGSFHASSTASVYLLQ